MRDESVLLQPLKDFADAVMAKMAALAGGEPEDQLRGPFENLMTAVTRSLGWNVVCQGETRLPDRIGKPDYAIFLNKLLAGYVELKAPGIGADPQRFTGHNREQWKRFQALPNLLYTDGDEWALYRRSERLRKIVRLSGNVATDGRKAVTAEDASGLEGLLRDFLTWQPILPFDSRGRLKLERFVDELAALCRMLRRDVTDALKDPRSPLVQLAKDWRKLLFPDASDEQFADAYAQTVTFALLLARSEGATPLTLANAETALAAEHSLLARALQVLTDPHAQAEISSSLNVLLRVVGEVPPAALAGPEDPWLHFYEQFLAAYDPKLRKDAGAYYTPVEVVQAQVRLIDDILTNRLGRKLGFADPGVVTLDPAAGTGTYLLGVIEAALNRVEEVEGIGAVNGRASQLAGNVYGFEIMVGPFAVCELRVSRALQDRGAKLPAGGTHIYLTDTLESPNAELLKLPLFLKPLADQHAKALQVKSKVPVIVCLGNPPYDRHAALDIEDERDLARCGGWVRFADPLASETVKEVKKGGRIAKRTLRTEREVLDQRQRSAILWDFVRPAVEAGHGVHVKNLYNLYVYFWRWALWKVFEANTAAGPGVASFISASSHLDGDAFCGMREHMRRLCDEIWILDLGGEGRGTRKSENVFAIQTPVAIAVAVRYGKPEKKTRKEEIRAKVYYARIEGTRAEKLRALEDMEGLGSLTWEHCPNGWHAPFRPAGTGAYFAWPLLTGLFPWQHSGVQLKRTWPIAPDAGVLQRRWHALLAAADRAAAFRETGDREVDEVYDVDLIEKSDSMPLANLRPDAPVPPIVRYAYRSLDRQFLIADGRLISRPRPDLWAAHSDRQAYLTSLFSQPLGTGPALTACAHLPDLDHFRGSYGAKAAIPLYRDRVTRAANILPELLEMLRQTHNREVSPEDFLAYVYGVLAQPAFTERFAKELETRELRVPLTKDPTLFAQVRDVGARLLWLHTYGERFVPQGHARGQIPGGKAHCTKAVPDDPEDYPERYWYTETTQALHVGDGEFQPVAREVYGFEVSGLKVVQSWLGYRMKKPKGRRSSPLDDTRPERWTAGFTTELLQLLWALEATLAEYPGQAKLLEAVVNGDLFSADELPPLPPDTRKPPGTSRPRRRKKAAESGEPQAETEELL